MKITGWRSCVQDILTGKGLEIGALCHPFPINDNTTITYVDRMSTDDLKKLYINDPSANINEMVTVDYVTDGSDLAMFTDDTFDFVCNSHIFEHLCNPLKALFEWVRVTKNGGYIYTVIPCYKDCFDHKRVLTDVDHIIKDYIDDVKEVELAHFEDFCGNVKPHNIEQAKPLYEAQHLQGQGSIHVHTFDEHSLKELFKVFDVIDFKKEGMNLCFIIRVNK